MSSHTTSSVRVAVTLSPVTEMRYVLGRVDPAGSQLELLTKVGQVILVMETLVEGGNVSGETGVGVASTVFALVLGEYPTVTTNGNSVAAKRFENCPAGQREHAVTPNSENCPATQLLQTVSSWVSSFSDVPPYVPAGQLAQDVACENGFKVGFAMNVPGEQHPNRAVLVPNFENALDGPLRDSHAPPHSV